MQKRGAPTSIGCITAIGAAAFIFLVLSPFSPGLAIIISGFMLAGVLFDVDRTDKDGAHGAKGRKRSKSRHRAVRLALATGNELELQTAALRRVQEAARQSERIWVIATQRRTTSRKSTATFEVSRDSLTVHLTPPSYGPEILTTPTSDVLRFESGDAVAGCVVLVPGYLVLVPPDLKPDEKPTIVPWNQIALGLTPTFYLEEGRAPTDSQQFGQRWRYANADGSPNRRSKDNRALPRFEYAELTVARSGNPNTPLVTILMSNVRAATDVVEELRPFVDASVIVEPSSTPDSPPPETAPLERPPHEVLGVPQDATLDELEAAYRSLAKRYHPDRFATYDADFRRLSEARMRELNQAYEQAKRQARA